MNQEASFSPEDVLASLSELPDVPGLKQRVEARLDVSLVGLGGAIAAESAPHLATRLTSHSRGVGPASRFAPSPGAMVTKLRGVLLATLAPTFVAGLLAGIAADRWYSARHPVAPTAISVQPKIQPSSVAGPAAPPQPLADVAIEHLPTREANSPVTVTTAPPPIDEPRATLADERRLLDSARATLARGEPQQGIAFLERHAKRFPRGTLMEEREALYVRILVAAGNDKAAALRATSFQRRFPNSIFLPVVERAILSISKRSATDAPKP